MSKLSVFKDILNKNKQEIQQDFNNKVDIQTILRKRSQTIDNLLKNLWGSFVPGDDFKASLIAVGGYGREEMHPASDVDLLVLLRDEPDAKMQELLADFVTQLWDMGLEIGHSVRTLDECVIEAKNDQTVITNLIESRLISGDSNLFNDLQKETSADKIWSSEDFFKVKIEEQKLRYKRYGDTAYRVEPNLKDGPGGLRDLQMIGWIFKREFGSKSLKALSETKEINLLNPNEYQELIEARDFLWKVRFVLHQITGKKTDRLLFDYQRELTHQFGYTNDENNQSIESFMQRYYRNITQLERLNELLLGLLREHILDEENNTIVPINKYYNNRGGYLELAQPGLFASQPHTLLEVFHIMQTRPEIKGLAPKTLRELRQNLFLIDEDYRNNVHHKQIFINIMSEPKGITFALRRMNRYGLLATYIPAFANIVGRMQYDLFHAYTVDDHTLNVVRNIRRLSIPKGAEELPFCSKIFKTLKKPMLLYLAGLFHDIAKGRGGSHSELGAQDALEFCHKHDLTDYDAQTVSWLVEQHLTLSSIAQRKDISDPAVIKEFADTVITLPRLDMLYLLTICDIRGTNPTLLNNWKHSLLKDLYRATRKYLQGNTQETQNTRELLQQKKDSVIKQLQALGYSSKDYESFVNRFNNNYIFQYTVDELVWQFTSIIQNGLDKTTLDIRENQRKDSSSLLVYTSDKKEIFIKIMAAIEQQRLNIVAARVASSQDGYALDTFYLLDDDGKPISEVQDKERLLSTIKKNLQEEELRYSFEHHRMPRQLKHFNAPTRVDFSQDDVHKSTVITIRTVDTAGLLTRIGQVFNQQGLSILDARISTLGEMAEDIFHVTSLAGEHILSDQKQEQIRQALIEKLKDNND